MSGDYEFYSPLFSKNGLSKSKNSTSRPTSRISSKSASSTSRPTSRISLPEERRQEREIYFHQVSPEETQQFSQLALHKEHFQHMLPEEHQQQFRTRHNRQESSKTDFTSVSAPANLLSNSRDQELLPPNSIQTLNNVHSIELSSAHNSVYNTNGSQLNLIPNSATMVSLPSPTISYPFSDEKRFNFNRGDPDKLSNNSKKSKRKLWIILALLAVIIIIIAASVIVVKVKNAAASNLQSNNSESNGTNSTDGTNSTNGTTNSNNSTNSLPSANNPTETNPAGDSTFGVSSITGIGSAGVNPSESSSLTKSSAPTPTKTNNSKHKTTSSDCLSPTTCTSEQTLCPPKEGNKCKYCADSCEDNGDGGNSGDSGQ
ncbi:hypothetical protein F8M41_014963 [Gigaspora margarita]|uniref:Uncharacterized protein n=1 Tax=Gigaspora margarita TaxID=4874 RepID=A0A8H4A0G1_GIGMA|nr:hypothetical protein F8M41_014963 [Gigaspora margarita]